MLKIYYILYCNSEYEQTIQYCVGFEGFINNLSGLYDNICNNSLSFANFNNNMEMV